MKKQELLICIGYNTCEDRDDCAHSKPHKKFKNICDDYHPLEEFHDCICLTLKTIRKEKIEKLNEISNKKN
jgi:hypothetical protein